MLSMFEAILCKMFVLENISLKSAQGVGCEVMYDNNFR